MQKRVCIGILFAINIYFFAQCACLEAIMVICIKWGYFLLGCLAACAVGIGEMSVLEQIYCRKRYCAYESYALDKNVWLQIIIVLAYYMGALLGRGILCNIEIAQFFLLMPMVLFVVLTKGTKVVWFAGGKVLFLNDKAILGQIIDMKEVENGIEVKCVAEMQEVWLEIINVKDSEVSKRMLGEKE